MNVPLKLKGREATGKLALLLPPKHWAQPEAASRANKRHDTN